GQIFTEHEDSIMVLDIANGRCGQGAMLDQLADGVDVGQLFPGHTGIEVLGADQFAQGKVAFQAGAGRADTDNALAVQQTSSLIQGSIDAHAQLGALQQRALRAVLAVDVAIAETAPIAQEIMVDRTIEAVFDAADLAVTFAGADIAAGGATVADARRELHVPFAVVALGMGLVGEYPGGADLGQVAGELAFQHAILDAAEIHLVMGAEHAEIGAAGIVLVVAHAAVAGNAAIHLVGNERAQILVDVGPLAEAITALVMTGHHRHVLQVAVPAFLA